MTIVKYILFLIIVSNYMNAQNKIPGVFNAVSKTFETDDKTYWIDFFEKDVAKIYKDGYVGLIDSSGTIICQPKYDAIFGLEDGVYKVSLDNKLGLMDNKGTEILAPFTTRLSDFKLGLATYMQADKYGHDKYGIVKKDGTFLTKAVYVLLLPREGFGYLFTKNDQVGLIDYDGKEHIAYAGKDMNEAIADTIIRTDYGMINKPKNCLPEGFFNSELLKFDEGLAITFKKVGDCYKYGFMDKSFQTVITPKYDWVEKFVNGFAVVSNKGKWGIIDAKGSQIIPCKYDSLKQLNQDRFVVSLNTKYGVIDSKNQIIIAIKYNPIFGLGQELYATHNNKKWGVINEKEKLVLPYEFDGITLGVATKYERQVSLPTGLIRQTLYGKGYHFDKLGKLDKESFGFSIYVEGTHNFLNDPSFFSPITSFAKFTSDTKIPNEIKKEKKYPFNEKLKNGFVIVGVEEKVDSNPFLVNSRVPNQKYYKKGIIDHNNQIIVPLIYDEIENNEDNPINIFVAKLNGKYGVIDLKNSIHIPFEYDFIKAGNGFFIIRKQIEVNQWEYAIYDFFGNELIPFSAASYEIIGAGVLQKKEENDSYFIDKKGKKININ